jgi:hypothetical protein
MRSTWFLSILLACAASPALAQEEGEKVYLYADSLGWILTQRADARGQPVTCEIATRAQPGARFALFRDMPPRFSVSLIGDPIRLLPVRLDSLSLEIDDEPRTTRRAADVEVMMNQVYYNGRTSSARVLGAKRLRIRASYQIDGKSGAGGYQTHEVDLAGLNALYPRMDATCDQRMVPGPSFPGTRR